MRVPRSASVDLPRTLLDLPQRRLGGVADLVQVLAAQEGVDRDVEDLAEGDRGADRGRDPGRRKDQ
ncbi:MAG: hypothetical protein CL908_22835 [Deltaproteobacteria bacterium]|nr:hypothetical protein [Deltaproteobacteria bacterium]